MTTTTSNMTARSGFRDALTVGLYSIGIGAGALAGFVGLLLVA